MASSADGSEGPPSARRVQLPLDRVRQHLRIPASGAAPAAAPPRPLSLTAPPYHGPPIRTADAPPPVSRQPRAALLPRKKRSAASGVPSASSAGASPSRIFEPPPEDRLAALLAAQSWLGALPKVFVGGAIISAPPPAPPLPSVSDTLRLCSKWHKSLAHLMREAERAADLQQQEPPAAAPTPSTTAAQSAPSAVQLVIKKRPAKTAGTAPAAAPPPPPAASAAAAGPKALTAADALAAAAQFRRALCGAYTYVLMRAAASELVEAAAATASAPASAGSDSSVAADLLPMLRMDSAMHTEGVAERLVSALSAQLGRERAHMRSAAASLASARSAASQASAAPEEGVDGVAPRRGGGSGTGAGAGKGGRGARSANAAAAAEVAPDRPPPVLLRRQLPGIAGASAVAPTANPAATACAAAEARLAAAAASFDRSSSMSLAYVAGLLLRFRAFAAATAAALPPSPGAALSGASAATIAFLHVSATLLASYKEEARAAATAAESAAAPAFLVATAAASVVPHLFSCAPSTAAASSLLSTHWAAVALSRFGDAFTAAMHISRAALRSVNEEAASASGGLLHVPLSRVLSHNEVIAARLLEQWAEAGLSVLPPSSTQVPGQSGAGSVLDDGAPGAAVAWLQATLRRYAARGSVGAADTEDVAWARLEGALAPGLAAEAGSALARATDALALRVPPAAIADVGAREPFLRSLARSACLVVECHVVGVPLRSAAPAAGDGGSPDAEAVDDTAEALTSDESLHATSALAALQVEGFLRRGVACSATAPGSGGGAAPAAAAAVAAQGVAYAAAFDSALACVVDLISLLGATQPPGGETPARASSRSRTEGVLRGLLVSGGGVLCRLALGGGVGAVGGEWLVPLQRVLHWAAREGLQGGGGTLPDSFLQSIAGAVAALEQRAGGTLLDATLVSELLADARAILAAHPGFTAATPEQGAGADAAGAAVVASPRGGRSRKEASATAAGGRGGQVSRPAAAAAAAPAAPLRCVVCSTANAPASETCTFCGAELAPAAPPPATAAAAPASSARSAAASAAPAEHWPQLGSQQPVGAAPPPLPVPVSPSKAGVLAPSDVPGVRPVVSRQLWGSDGKPVAPPASSAPSAATTPTASTPGAPAARARGGKKAAAAAAVAAAAESGKLRIMQRGSGGSSNASAADAATPASATAESPAAAAAPPPQDTAPAPASAAAAVIPPAAAANGWAARVGSRAAAPPAVPEGFLGRAAAAPAPPPAPSPAVPAAAAEPSAAPRRSQASGKRVVVLDARNIAMQAGEGLRFVVSGISRAASAFQRQGCTVIAFLPAALLDAAETDARRRDAASGAKALRPVQLPDDSEQLQALVRKHVVFRVPTQDHDDAYILRHALNSAPGACVVSNDRFRDWEASFPLQLRPVAHAWILSHVISFTFVGRAATSTAGQLEFLPNPGFEWPDNAVSSQAAALLLGGIPRRLAATSAPTPPSAAPAPVPAAEDSGRIQQLTTDTEERTPASSGPLAEPKASGVLPPVARAVQRAGPPLLTPSAIAAVTPQPSSNSSPLVVAPIAAAPSSAAAETASLVGASDDVFALPLFAPGDTSASLSGTSGLFTGALALGGVGGSGSNDLGLPSAGFGLLPSLSSLAPLETASAAADVSDQLGIEWPQLLELELEPLLPTAAPAFVPPPQVPTMTPAQLEQELWAKALGLAAGTGLGNPAAGWHQANAHHAHRGAAYQPPPAGAGLSPLHASALAELARQSLAVPPSGAASAHPTLPMHEQQLPLSSTLMPSGLLLNLPRPHSLIPAPPISYAASAPLVTPALTGTVGVPPDGAAAGEQYEDSGSADGDPESGGDDEDADIDDLLADVFSFAVGT